jgi:hypothetical protein
MNFLVLTSTASLMMEYLTLLVVVPLYTVIKIRKSCGPTSFVGTKHAQRRFAPPLFELIGVE